MEKRFIDKNINNNIPVAKRLMSMFIDHCILTFSFGFVVVVLIFIVDFRFDKSYKEDILLYGVIIFFLIYFGKDSFDGRSPAKRILDLQIIDCVTLQPASPLRCFFRNIFCIVWPLEVLITLKNPNRRMGDKFAGTFVANYTKK